ncbi:MEthylTransferase Like [Trichostrongylus colubriformis]|uniref:MEthylTransferase Like n=1 Tax=Trichostrongylus colubriformis TaxID=6319 RepID=A0AAN8IRK7_TRICO
MLRYFNVHRFSACCRYSSAIPSTSKAEESNELDKTVRAGVNHVKSVNVITRKKSIVELKPMHNLSRKFRREYALPEQAISGLRNALVTCERSPKQLQHEADQLSEVLSQRRFPATASVVREVRNKVKAMLKEKQDTEVMSDFLEEKITSAIDYKERHEVDKILKKANFNWKPLAIESKEGAAAYALSRLAPNYAEIARVLDEFEGNDFSPASVLDYGCGIGAGFWAVNERFGTTVKEYCMVDPSLALTQLSMDIMRDQNGNLLHHNLNFRRHLVPSLRTKYDLVIAHRTLCELGSRETRLETIASLWKRTNRFLVLIDSGLQSAFEALIEARDFLLLSGTQLHLQETISLLQEHNLMTSEIHSVLHERHVSDFERFTVVRDMVPADMELPTALPPATVYAPCPHDLGCPLLGSKTPCTFPIRWKVIRADGKRSRYEESGTQTGKFSFVILEKSVRPPQDVIARILKIRPSHGHVTCDLCTAFKGIQRLTISRRAGHLYQRVRARRDGELFPLEMKTVTTESMFDRSNTDDHLQKETDLN